MLYKSLRTHNRIMLLLATALITAIAFTACSGEDDTPPTPQPTATSAPAATPTPERPTPTPPEELVAVVTQPEPGSEESKILAVLERQLKALNEENYDNFVETCAPSGRNQQTEEQLRSYVFEDIWGDGKTKPHGYNVRDVEVKMLRAPFAQTEFDLFYFDQYFDSLFWTWENVDGEWYLEVFPCQ